MLNLSAQDMMFAYICFQLYCALVQSLPEPSEVGGIWYKSFYKFLTIIAADFKSYVNARTKGA